MRSEPTVCTRYAPPPAPPPRARAARKNRVRKKRRPGGRPGTAPRGKPARVQQYSHERPRTRDKTGRAAGRAARRRTSCVGGGRRARIAHIAHRAPGLTARCSTVTVRPNHSHSRQDDASRTVPRRHHARPGRGYRVVPLQPPRTYRYGHHCGHAFKEDAPAATHSELPTAPAAGLSGSPPICGVILGAGARPVSHEARRVHFIVLF